MKIGSFIPWFVMLVVLGGSIFLVEQKKPIASDSSVDDEPVEIYEVLTQNEILPREQKVEIPAQQDPQAFQTSPLAVDQIKENKDGRLQIEPVIEDATGSGNVRKSSVGVETEYKISNDASLGVVATTELEDQGDASAWNEKTENEQTAVVQYKLNF